MICILALSRDVSKASGLAGVARYFAFIVALVISAPAIALSPGVEHQCCKVAKFAREQGRPTPTGMCARYKDLSEEQCAQVETAWQEMLRDWNERERARWRRDASEAAAALERRRNEEYSRPIYTD